MRRSILVSLGAATVAAVFLATGAAVDAQRVGQSGGGPEGRQPAFANAQARRGGQARGVRQGRRDGPARRADRLDLTTEQRDAVAVINQESRDVIAPLAEELRLAENNLQRAIFADSPDLGAVETLSAQVAGLHQQMAEARVRARVAVAAELTEEQRTKMRIATGRGPVAGRPAGRRGLGALGQRPRG